MRRALAAAARRPRTLVAGLAAAALVTTGAAAGHGTGPARVVAADREGVTVASLALPRSGEFALAYRHSYYRRPAVERFRAADDGSFRLVAIASPSEAVLDYYELEGVRARRGGWWTLRPAKPARFEAMPLAATATGRRTLVAGGARVPLYEPGRAAHLVIDVEGT